MPRVESIAKNPGGEQPKHLPQLDGVRGLAVLFVMFYHFVDAALRGGWHGTAAGGFYFIDCCSAGWVGVDLFFVLSGFLITEILVRTKQSKYYLSSFFIRRFLRIFPLYYGLLLGLLVLLPLVCTPPLPNYAALEQNQGWYWGFMTNYLVALNGGFRDFPLGFFWSLAIEEQFYALWPFAVLLLSRRGLMRLCAALFIASTALRLLLLSGGYAPTVVYVLTCTHLEPIVVGAFLAVAVQNGRLSQFWDRAFQRLAAASLLLLVVLFARSSRLYFWDREVAAVAPPLLAVLFGYLLYMAWDARPSSVRYALFSSPLFRSFGRLCFALYVFHPFVGHLIRDYVFDPVPAQASAPSVLRLLVFVGLAVAGSWLLAFLSWHLYEKHFLKLKSWFTPDRLAARGGATGRQPNSPALTTT